MLFLKDDDLLSAAEKGDLAAVRRSLLSGKDVDTCDQVKLDGRNCLT